jgi:2-polyprenyl-6-methoxyphenol hydroxylase-like FAD-dependent oxidoreductase
MTLSENTQVLVVGAGPTGLLLAAELVRRDVRCVLIDELDAPRGWDRATVVHERSLEIFEALGLADTLIDGGVQTRTARFHSDGRPLAQQSLDIPGTRYGYQLGVSEEVTESVLTDYLEAKGGGVVRSTRLIGLDLRADGVTATLERAGGHHELVAEWVVGCDGHHSTVRQIAGIEFPGADIDTPWAVFDATLDRWDDEYDDAYVYLDQPPVILTPLPGRRWRVYLRPQSETGDLVAEAGEVLRLYAPQVKIADVEDAARFYCHSRVAARYRTGRALLAGDAAHACTPAEGHGMNTGLQDAFNLGWKLALVCRGDAGAGLLDTYESERRPVAELIVSTGTEVELGEAMTGIAERAERDEAIRQAFGDPDTAHHEAAAASEIDRVYASSRVVTGDDNPALGPGVLLPDTPDVEPADGPPQPLHELAHRPGLTLLVLGGPRAAPGRVAELVGELESRRGPVLDAVIGVRLDDAVAAQLGVEDVTVLGVRPDRYVGFRDDRGDPAAVDAYLSALLA